MTEDKAELQKLFEASKNDENIITVSTTVDTGLEWQAIGECKEKLNSNLTVIKDRGKIFFNVSVDDFPKVAQLRSVDNIFIVSDLRHLHYDAEDNEKNLSTLKEIVANTSELNKCLNIWKKVVCFPGKIFPSLEEYEAAVGDYKLKKEVKENTIDNDAVRGKKKRGGDPSLADESSILSYRVTCERNGIHTFESGEVAAAIGGEFQDRYHWIVDLSFHQLEILCRINHGEVMLNLRVTKESMHRRNIAYFGPTTLRATVCYNLLRLAKPKPGDIIIDPMCGGGSIPIEGALDFPNIYILGGDNHEKAVERSRLNFAALPYHYKSDLLQWNVTKLPFRDSYVDAFVTDMPFGKRMGSKSDNRVMYKKYLLELARVVRLKHGRLVLLTHDRRSISIALQAAKDLFSVKKTLNVNIGGLNAAAYVLKRTNLTYEQFKSTLTTVLKIKKSGVD